MHALRDGFVEISVIQNDIGRFAAKFLRHTFDRIGGRFGNHDTGARRTGKRHHVDIGMLRHGLTDGRPVAIDQIENTGRHAGIIQNFSKKRGVERRHFETQSTMGTRQPARARPYRRSG